MNRLLLALLAVLTLGREFAAARLPVTPADAFVWMQAQRLDWAYFDGPGGMAALAHLGGVLLGDHPLALRIFAPLFAALATIAVYRLGRRWFGENAGLGAALGLNALPLFNAAAVHAGPQMPALALGLAAAAAFARAFEGRTGAWLVAGVLAALAVNVSFAALLVPLTVILVCVAFRRQRVRWREPGIYLALAIIVLSLLPAALWNHAHRWPFLALGTARSLLTPDGAALGPAFATILAWVSLPMLLAALVGLARLAAEARLHAKPRLALVFLVPSLLVALHGALRGGPNETVLLLAAGFALVPAAAGLLTSAWGRWVGAVAVLAAAALTAFPPQPPADSWNRSAAGAPWAAVAGQLRTLLRQLPPGDRPPFVVAPSPDATAALNYHLAGTGSEVYLRESQDLSNQFGLWPRYDDFVATDRPADEFFRLEGSTTNPNLGRNALYVTDEPLAELPQTITAAFGRVTPHATFTLRDGRKLRVYLCENYQTMPL